MNLLAASCEVSEVEIEEFELHIMSLFPLVLDIDTDHFAIAAFPTVATKNPSVHNSPPQSSFLSAGCRRNNSRAVMLLIICITLDGENFGAALTR